MCIACRFTEIKSTLMGSHSEMLVVKVNYGRCRLNLMKLRGAGFSVRVLGRKPLRR